MFRRLRWACLAALALACVAPARAHGPDHTLESAATAPAPGARVETIEGRAHRVTVDDRVAGMSVEILMLRLDDGRAVNVTGLATSGVATGDRVRVSGKRNGSAVFASDLRVLSSAGRPAAKSAESIDGTLALLHADYLQDGRSEFIFEVHQSNGRVTTLDLPLAPEVLGKGMHVAVRGVMNAAQDAIAPDVITITSLAPADAKSQVVEKAASTKTVLVILVAFSDTPAGGVPFSQAQVQSVFAAGPGSGSVTEFFKEASYGQQLLNPTVTGWLTAAGATPSTCDWRTIGTLARNAATAAGYNLSSYQDYVYVFPKVPACSWIGLAYIGGAGVWINGYNQTNAYAHELGHNFGLLHAGSLSCGGASIGGSCSVTEYGDPFGAMGNHPSWAMHYNAMQKANLGWIPAGSVVTHASGTGTYTLAPLENAGGTTYAIKVPAAANRTYWLEFRQPIGFDSPLSGYPTNGAQVRVATPFETYCSGCDAYSNDTQLLDMTPGTSTVLDAALTVGNRFTDPTYGITFNVLSANATALTLQVSVGASQAATTTSLSSSANPATAGSTVTFTATVAGSAPTGTVTFADNGTTIGGCAAVALSGSGNSRTASCSTSALVTGTHPITAAYSGDAGNAASTSGALSEVINAAAPSAGWIDDSVPAGAAQAGDLEGWNWVSSPTPFSGSLAHQSGLASGMHQHYFYGASATMAVQVGDTLYAYVYLDPANPPTEVMLQWNDGWWEHRAYWGANQIGWGVDGTNSRRYMGALPATGQWVRLAVPAAQVGLEGAIVNGMAFTLYNGRATWDLAGRQ